MICIHECVLEKCFQGTGFLRGRERGREGGRERERREGGREGGREGKGGEMFLGRHSSVHPYKKTALSFEWNFGLYSVEFLFLCSSKTT